EPRDGAIDPRIGEEWFYVRRKPRYRCAFPRKSFERGEASHRVLSLAFKIGGFRYLCSGTVDLRLPIGDLGEGARAGFLQRPEEEREVNVKQKDKAHRAERQFL